MKANNLSNHYYYWLLHSLRLCLIPILIIISIKFICQIQKRTAKAPSRFHSNAIKNLTFANLFLTKWLHATAWLNLHIKSLLLLWPDEILATAEAGVVFVVVAQVGAASVVGIVATAVELVDDDVTYLAAAALSLLTTELPLQTTTF